MKHKIGPDDDDGPWEGKQRAAVTDECVSEGVLVLDAVMRSCRQSWLEPSVAIAVASPTSFVAYCCC